jgi:hypothetical protein
MTGPGVRLRIVRGLNTACTLVDRVVYRPAVVKATVWLPRWWNCQLAQVSMKLDDRWGTGFWESGEDGGPDADYLAAHEVKLCGWCKLDFSEPPADRGELDRMLADARARSVSWSWRG